MYPYIYIVLPSYVVFAFLGSFFAIIFVYFRIDKIQMEFNAFLKILALCILCALIGSKLLYIITRFSWEFGEISIYRVMMLFLNSGYVYYGGLFGALLAIKIFADKVKKYNKRDVFNMIAPAIPLFHGFGRVGCFCAGCCYGVELEPTKIIMNNIRLTRVPTQIIEAIFEFAFFIILVVWERRNPEIDKLKIYLMGYSFFRFFIEFFRGDEIRGIYYGLSTAQWISMAIFFYYLVLKKCIKSQENLMGA